MLANYHFLVRNYIAAVDELEALLRAEPANTKAKKKLVICYTQTGMLDRALVTFAKLIQEDFNCVVSTDAAWEDCPCPGLVTHLEEGRIRRGDDCSLFLELGILWLYCDRDKSLYYFRRARQCAPEHYLLSSIIHVIESHTHNEG